MAIDRNDTEERQARLDVMIETFRTAQQRRLVERHQRNDEAARAGHHLRSEQERLDASYESDARGEHRYDHLHQSAAEQDSRRQRDELKRRLAGLVAPRR